MIGASEYAVPREMDPIHKLDEEGILPSQHLRERIIVSPACCTLPVQRMLLMQEVLAELSAETDG